MTGSRWRRLGAKAGGLRRFATFFSHQRPSSMTRVPTEFEKPPSNRTLTTSAGTPRGSLYRSARSIRRERILDLAQEAAMAFLMVTKRNRFFRDLYLRRRFEQHLDRHHVRLVVLSDLDREEGRGTG